MLVSIGGEFYPDTYGSITNYVKARLYCTSICGFCYTVFIL